MGTIITSYAVDADVEDAAGDAGVPTSAQESIADGQALQDNIADSAQQSTIDEKSGQTGDSQNAVEDWPLEVGSGAFYSKENDMYYRFYLFIKPRILKKILSCYLFRAILYFPSIEM